MDLLFRLSKKDEDLKDHEKFFKVTLLQRDKSYFYESQKRKQLEKDDEIFYSYDGYIVAHATFTGEIIENNNRESEIFIHGHGLKNIQLVSTQKKLNTKIVSSRTTYIDKEEKRQEIHRVLSNSASIYPDEIDNDPKIEEGAKKKIIVNSYERSEEARNQCINKYGYKCYVCKLDFKKIYGEIGNDFIHVHHLKPLHEIKQGYKINPVDDLKPVCPNCHAMLHRKKPIYNIEELQEIIEKNAPHFLTILQE